MTGERVTAPAPERLAVSRAQRAVFIFKKAVISALVALVLFSLMIGVRTEAGPSGQLTYWSRFDDLAAMVAAVFGGSIVVELLRQWWGPVGVVRTVPPSVQNALAVARRTIAPVANAVSLVVVVLMPRARQATSSSRNASQARPIGSRRKRMVTQLVKSASARIR